MKEWNGIVKYYWIKIKCLFNYLCTLKFTVKRFKVTYYCTEVYNIETTVIKECENYMKQMFKIRISF